MPLLSSQRWDGGHAAGSGSGGVVVGEVTQQIDKPNPAMYLGKGKVEGAMSRYRGEECVANRVRRRALAISRKEHRGATGQR